MSSHIGFYFMLNGNVFLKDGQRTQFIHECSQIVGRESHKNTQGCVVYFFGGHRGDILLRAIALRKARCFFGSLQWRAPPVMLDGLDSAHEN